MGCLSHHRKHVEVRPEQKWDYISLQDFKSTSCGTPFAYAYLWLSIFISGAVYAVDTFTAVNILAFKRFFPTFEEELRIISREAAKWIFTSCIILSFINLFYEYVRAYRIMKRGSVAECYLDNIAVRAESARMGKGQGWRRFLVFAELTKSKKGAEYVALFTYFSFQSWIRVLVCSGPRQFVNAMFLYTYARSEFVITTDDTIQTGLGSIFNKIKAIATEDPRQALILSGMLFTFIIWVISFISLLMAFFFFIFFLWHWIPRSDGGLSGYCERKINKRLTQIVTIKINKALAKEDQARTKRFGEEPPDERQATLPSFMDDKLPAMPTLQRTDTVPTLPAYTSRPSTPGATFEMEDMDQKRPGPNRTNTAASSATNISSKTGLIGAAAAMGYRPASPTPSLPAPDLGTMESPNPSMTTNMNRGYGLQTQYPPGTSGPARYGSPSPSSGRPAYGGHQRYGSDHSNDRASAASSKYSQPSIVVPPPRHAYGQGREPMRSATGPISARGPQYPPSRSTTASVPRQQQPDSFGKRYVNDYRYDYDVESQRGPRF